MDASRFGRIRRLARPVLRAVVVAGPLLALLRWAQDVEFVLRYLRKVPDVIDWVVAAWSAPSDAQVIFSLLGISVGSAGLLAWDAHDRRRHGKMGLLPDTDVAASLFGECQELVREMVVTEVLPRDFSRRIGATRSSVIDFLESRAPYLARHIDDHSEMDKLAPFFSRFGRFEQMDASSLVLMMILLVEYDDHLLDAWDLPDIPRPEYRGVSVENVSTGQP